MLETPIINATKAVRAIKKWPDELSIYDFANKVNPSVDINVITNSLKTMTEIQKAENKPFNGKSSYYLTECKNTHSDGMNLRNSLSRTPEILSTPFIEENSLNRTHSPNVEDQINSFVSSGTKPQDTGFSDTFNLHTAHKVMSNIKKSKTFYYKTLKPKYVNFYKTKSTKD